MTTQMLCLIGCVKQKQKLAAPAKELYTSTLFRSARAYAEGRATKWFILSAKHCLLSPETVIDPYELTLKDLAKPERLEWAKRVLKELVPHLRDTKEVEIIAGVDYREHLVGLLKEQGIEVSEPLARYGLGMQISWLREHTSPKK